MTSILTGESLVNDATALTLFSISVAAVSSGHATWTGGVLQFLYNAVAGAIIGGIFAVVTLWVRKRLGNATLETALVLLVPFTAFLVAEEAHASGILAVVVAALGISANLTFDPQHQYPGAYRTRLQEGAVWPVVDFLLETFVFAYIGLQLKWVLEDLAEAPEPGLGRTLLAAGVLLVAAIVLRLAGVFGLFGRWTLKARMLRNRLARHPEFKERFEAAREQQRSRRRGEPPTQKETLLVGWTGMRGILTLAAAAAVPATTSSGEAFEQQRHALGEAVMKRVLDEQTAKEMIEDLDLRQAARHAAG